MQCELCGSTIRRDSKSSQCRPCRSVCPCGKRKDHRVVECGSCQRTKQAKYQWAHNSASIRKGLRLGGLKRRFRFSDISASSNWGRKNDGRYWIWYWDDLNQHRTIYRYQWVWIQAHGPIPKGYHVHHKNENPSDDRLENLEMLAKGVHAKHHGALVAARAPIYNCHGCHKQFRSKAKKGRGRRYCSKSCWYKHYQRKSIEHAQFDKHDVLPTSGKLPIGAQ